ncbi:hypothetical protein HZ326_29649 [Fusarium oxysporum f. sp. albedinis]|nr:hypothetical protein HZ326_29649 [Fusarium oxysporum f. sp. albedinis]
MTRGPNKHINPAISYGKSGTSAPQIIAWSEPGITYFLHIQQQHSFSLLCIDIWQGSIPNIHNMRDGEALVIFLGKPAQRS